MSSREPATTRARRKLTVEPAESGLESDAHALEIANKILSQLTLDEKVALTYGSGTMSVGPIPGAGLNEDFWMSDNSHTVRPDLDPVGWEDVGNDNEATNLPSLQALAATWNVQTAARFGGLIGREARHRGKDMMLGPGVNIMRTPLCGRNWEYMSEDPWLAASLAVPYIRALQANGVVATVKHFAVNNQELDRNAVDTYVDERALREIYFPVFHAAVVDGGALAVMNAYNRFRGDFCSHGDYLNNRILKGEWGFKGLVVSDWGGLHDCIRGALGGTDIEMDRGSNIRHFKYHLLEAVQDGDVPPEVVDDKARRVLFVMAKIGKIGTDKPRKPGARNTPDHAALARRIAEEAIVLLKNEGHVLPLRKGAIKNLLVVGEHAVTRHCRGGGSAVGLPPYEITPLEGLRAYLGGDVTINYLPLGIAGAGIRQIPLDCIRTVDAGNRESFEVRGWKVEYFNGQAFEGEAVQSFAEQAHFEWDAANPPAGSGESGFSIRLSAKVAPKTSGCYRLAAATRGAVRISVDDQAVLDCPADGPTESKTADADLRQGQSYTVVIAYSQPAGDGALRFGWDPPGVADEQEYIAKARAADAVLIFTGTTHEDGPEMRESEGSDRAQFSLPEYQLKPARLLLGVNPDTIVINHSGSAVDLGWAADSAPAIIQEPYNGQEAGNALAKVLFGHANPSAKLPFSIPRKLTDIGAHDVGDYQARSITYNEGIYVGYRRLDKLALEPLYPFGHGLSYTTFAIGPPTLSATEIDKDETVEVTLKVANTGAMAGAEVVQLYISPPDDGIDRPPRELKGFAKIFLEPGQTGHVTIPITLQSLSYWDTAAGGWRATPGAYKIQVGNSSRNLPHTALLTCRRTSHE